jgi:hypothetical protein
MRAVRLKPPTDRGEEEPVRRTSVEFPVSTWKRAKQAALAKGESLRDLILRAVDAELEKLGHGKKSGRP